MQKNKTVSRIVGGLFLAAMLTYGVGSGLVDSVLNSSDPLTAVANNGTTFTAGAVLMFLNSAVVIGIGVLMLPILRRYNERVANTYLATRIMEGLMLGLGIVSLLSIGRLQDASLVEAATTTNFNAYQGAMAVLGLGSIGFTYLLYKTNLVPRPLALLGVVGYASLMAGAVLELSGFGVGLMMSIPGGLFELALPVWLFKNGFAGTESPKVALDGAVAA
jgi:hypothetical protein